MTYTELIQAVRKLLPTDGFAVMVNYWDPNCGVESLEWKIWDVRRGKHFEGKTPEAALQALVVASGLEVLEAAPLPERVASVNAETIKIKAEPEPVAPADIPF